MNQDQVLYLIILITSNLQNIWRKICSVDTMEYPVSTHIDWSELVSRTDVC